MILQVYSLFDKKAGFFGQPFYARSKGEAMRMVMASLGNKDQAFSQFPNDYSLFYVADWNDAIGSFVPAVGGATEVVQVIELVMARNSEQEVPDLLRTTGE